MVDPFLDPLDASPVEHPTPRARNRYESLNSQQSSSFQEILSRKIDESATPIMTPDALQIPPVLYRKKAATDSQEDKQDVNTTQNTTQRQKTIVESIEPQPTPQTESNQEKIAPQESTPKQEPIQEQTATSSSKQTEIKPPIDNMARLLNIQIDNRPPESKKEETVVETPLRNEKSSDDAPASRVEEIVVPSEGDMTHTVQRGDTLSAIVLSALRKTGVDFETKDVYHMVNVIASYNNISNPNRIFAGNQIDLTPIYSGQMIAEEKPIQTTRANIDIPTDYQPPAYGEITSTFGNRIHPIFRNQQFHNGVDIALATGTPILPVKGGLVTFSGEKSGYGQVVEIDHEDGTQSLYGHLSKRQVQEGDRITRNDFVGMSGESGRTTGPHLHLEIHQNDRPIDPLLALSREQIEIPPQIASNDVSQE